MTAPCIVKILHEKSGELTKDMTPFAEAVYHSDCPYITSVLKGTFTSLGTGRGLGLENDMPLPEKPEPRTAARIPGSAATPPPTQPPYSVGYDIPRNMRESTEPPTAGKIWKNVMDEIHRGSPLDLEHPRPIPSSGVQMKPMGSKILSAPPGSVPGSAKPS